MLESQAPNPAASYPGLWMRRQLELSEGTLQMEGKVKDGQLDRPTHLSLLGSAGRAFCQSLSPVSLACPAASRLENLRQQSSGVRAVPSLQCIDRRSLKESGLDIWDTYWSPHRLSSCPDPHSLGIARTSCTSVLGAASQVLKGHSWLVSSLQSIGKERICWVTLMCISKGILLRQNQVKHSEVRHRLEVIAICFLTSLNTGSPCLKNRLVPRAQWADRGVYITCKDNNQKNLSCLTKKKSQSTELGTNGISYFSFQRKDSFISQKCLPVSYQISTKDLKEKSSKRQTGFKICHLTIRSFFSKVWAIKQEKEPGLTAFCHGWTQGRREM